MELLRRRAAKGPTPPGPRGVPFVGGLLTFSRDPLGALLRTTREYGDFVCLGDAGRHKLFLLNHPQYVRHVLTENHRNYGKGNLAAVFKAIVGEGLPMAEGEAWQRSHRLIQPAFHRERIGRFT